MINAGEINAKFDANFEASRLRQDECVKRIEASVAKLSAYVQTLAAKVDDTLARSFAQPSIPIQNRSERTLVETFKSKSVEKSSVNPSVEVGEVKQESQHAEIDENPNEVVEVIEDAKVVCIKESAVQEVNYVDQKIKYEKKYIIEVEHVDFILPNFIFESKVASNFVLVSMLFPKIVLQTHRLCQFCWNISPNIWFVIL